MLLMVQKRIRGGICHAIHRCAKVNNNYMKDYDKNKELPYLLGWEQFLRMSNLKKDNL